MEVCTYGYPSAWARASHGLLSSTHSAAPMCWMYWPFIHDSFVSSKMASFLVMRSSENSEQMTSRLMMVVSPSSDQPRSARKLTIASGRNPRSRYSSTLVAPWRLESFLPSGPRIIDRCANVGVGRPSAS